MQPLRLTLIAATSCGLSLLALELLFRLLPVSSATLTGYHLDADLLTYPPAHTWTVATGWDLRNVQTLHSNAHGYAAEREFAPDPQALVLIGDSFVEASALDARDRPAAQLQGALGAGRSVYGLGIPGTALVDYAQRLRYAHQQFGSRDFVVWLEAADLRQSLCGSGHVISRCLDPVDLSPQVQRLPPPDALKRLARHSALAQYVFSQLKFNPVPAWAERAHQPPTTARAAAAARSSAGELAAAQRLAQAAVAEFMAQAMAHSPRRLLFVMDGHHDGSPAGAAGVDLERRELMAQLQARGQEVLDLQPLYERQRAASRLSLEIGPDDHHLNPLGVRRVMAAVAQQLGKPGPWVLRPQAATP